MRRLIALLAFVSMLVLLLAVPVQAEPPLVGTMDLEFNLAWPGPQEDIPIWVGTITIDSTEYGMEFFNLGTGKAFDEDRGVVGFFQEVWTIYELDYDEILLWGYDKGVVCYQNSKYVMNGNVEEATGDFAGWQGHRVHMSGEIIWDEDGSTPHYAPGIFRID